MLGQHAAIANIPVRDMTRAREFYEAIIGLTPVQEMEDAFVAYTSGPSRINVYVSNFAGTNQATAVSWEVADLPAAVAELRSKGVRFEHYDFPGTTLDGDIHRSEEGAMVWFKDPDGNILHVYEG